MWASPNDETLLEVCTQNTEQEAGHHLVPAESFIGRSSTFFSWHVAIGEGSH